MRTKVREGANPRRPFGKLIAVLATMAALAGGALFFAPASASAFISQGCEEWFECDIEDGGDWGSEEEGWGSEEEGGWGFEEEEPWGSEEENDPFEGWELEPDPTAQEIAEGEIQERADREDAEREERRRAEAEKGSEIRRSEAEERKRREQWERELAEDPVRVAEEILNRIQRELESLERSLELVHARCDPIISYVNAEEEAGRATSGGVYQEAVTCISELGLQDQRATLERERLERERNGPASGGIEHETKNPGASDSGATTPRVQSGHPTRRARQHRAAAKRRSDSRRRDRSG